MNFKEYPFSKCLNPQKIMNPYTHETLVVPCGKCKACHTVKAYRYNIQCQLEASSAKHVLFVTLTYRDEDLPLLYYQPVYDSVFGNQTAVDLFDSDGVLLEKVDFTDRDLFEYQLKVDRSGCIPYLRKRDIQLFVKRLRSSFDYELQRHAEVRYFICGEYGPEHYRPHYHCLFFLQEDWFLEPSGHTFGEFPAYLWYNPKAQYPKTSTDVMSNFEYYLYTRWSFGRIDCQITQGNCSSYVTTYVNSFSSVPKILKARTSRPFAVHSKLLGQVFFKDISKEVYEAPYSSFIEKSYTSSSGTKPLTLWASYYNVFFPRCKGYANKTSSKRLYSYTLYAKANKLFPECKTLADVARSIVVLVHFYHFSLKTSYNYDSLTPELKTLIDYFYEPISNYLKVSYVKPDDSVSFDFSSPDLFDKLVSIVYLELLTSKHFFRFCMVHSGLNPRSMLKKIEDFYDWMQANNLQRFFEQQQLYFDCDFAEPTDYVFFYNNTQRWSLDAFKESFSYKSYAKSVDDLYRSRIKHKRYNDMCDIFSNNG